MNGNVGEGAPSFDAIADGLIRWAVEEPAVKALWVEGASAREIRRPYSRLDLHIAVDEPDFDPVLAELPALLAELFQARCAAIEDVPRFAKELRLEWEGGAHGSSVRVTLERTSLLAKRPRAYVAALFDRTAHLPHVLDYSLRRAAARRHSPTRTMIRTGTIRTSRGGSGGAFSGSAPPSSSARRRSRSPPPAPGRPRAR